MIKKTYEKYGAIVCKMKDNSVLIEVLNIIEAQFSKPDAYYSSISRNEFLELGYAAQEKISNLNVQKRFIESERPVIEKLLGEVNIYAQSSCFLRCIRPLGKDSSKEAVDYHRETFYSDNPDTTKTENQPIFIG